MLYEPHIYYTENGLTYEADLPKLSAALIEGESHAEALLSIYDGSVRAWMREMKAQGHQIETAKARLIPVSILPQDMPIEQVKLAYRHLFYALGRMLYELFPIAPELPEDEWYGEAHCVMEHLPEAHSANDLAVIMRDVFAESFGSVKTPYDERAAGPVEKYVGVAEEFWALGSRLGIWR